MDWKTVFTIIGSFGAASTAQIINHILTQNREDKKHYKECLQNFYSPLVHKYIDLIKGEGIHNCPNEVFNVEFSNKVTLFEEILKITEQNLKYADAELINSYQELINHIDSNDVSDMLNDPDEDELWVLIIKMANIFFSNYIEINKKLKTNTNSISEKITAPYFFTHFYLLVNECFIIEEIPSDKLFGIYDLIEFVLLPVNNYTKRIIRIRKELYTHWYYSSTPRSLDSYTDACQFIYEILDQFEIASEERSWEFKDMLDELIM